MHTRPFQAPSTFSTKESTFGVGFQLQRRPAKHQCTGSRRQPRPTLYLWQAMAWRETRKHCFPEQTRIGAELGFPRRVSFSPTQLPEASFVPFLRWALVGASIAGGKWCLGASAHKAFSGPISFLPKGEHVWSWFPALAMTCKALVHREQEAARPSLFLWQAQT